jgi:hypothetical protein
MKGKALAAILSLIVSAATMAADVLVEIKGATPGKTYAITLDASGKVTTVREVQTVTVGNGGPVNPVDPPPTSDLAQEITKWTKAVNPATKPETVKALAAATKAIRSQVQSGKTKWSDVWGGKKLFSTAYDVILGAQDETTAWKGWRKNHTDEVIRQTQDPANGLNSDAEVIKLLEATEAGLEGHLAGAFLGGNFPWRKVIKLVTLLLDSDGFDLQTIFDILDILRGQARAAAEAAKRLPPPPPRRKTSASRKRGRVWSNRRPLLAGR